MITNALRFVLLSFALVAYAGAGASAAVIRQRWLADGETDWGLAGVASLLFTFAALCTALGAGWSGVLAFGGVALFTAYVSMARHIGLFEVEAGSADALAQPAEEPRQPK